MKRTSWTLASISLQGRTAVENAGRWLPHSDRESFSQFLGASLLSATGSLPQHLGPLIIIAIVADGRIPVSEAGWILSVRAIGELLTSIVLPLIGMAVLGRTVSLAASALFVGALLVAQLADLAAMLLGFFLLGATGGVLKFLGTLAASTYRNRTFAFLFRLASVLGIAGAAICVLYVTNAFTSYPTLLEWLTVIVAPVLLFGGFLYKPLEQPASGPAHRAQSKSMSGLFGLLILYLFFVAISGFMAYVGQQAAMRGLSVKDTVLSIGTIKIAAAAWLLIAASFLPRNENKEIVAWEVGLLLIAIWLVSLSSTVLEFFAGLLLLEIALNGCSARLQSAIVGAAPHFAGRWLNGVILLGIASGPPLYGLAIGAGMQTAFLTLGSAVICLPLVWQACRVQFPRYQLAGAVTPVRSPGSAPR